MAIDKDQIIDAAFDILGEQGMDGLNIRAICDRLEVGPPTIYWHVGKKPDLMQQMSRRIYERAIVAANDSCSGAPEAGAWLMAYGHALRGLMLGWRDTAMLCALARQVDKDPEAAMRMLVAPLTDAGVDYDLALRALASVNALTLGWVSYQQRDAETGYLASVMDFDDSYATGLGILVKGALGAARG